jgi:uncharacterized membrane protein
MNETLRYGIELVASLIEALAVALMVGLIAFGTVRWLFFSGGRLEKAYPHYRVVLGKSLLVGLELLVAADIIRTVALDSTLLNIGTLAALVLVRTFLGWTLTVEVESRWPWQPGKEPTPGVTEGALDQVSPGAIASAAPRATGA